MGLHPSHPNLHSNNTWVLECPTDAPQNFPYPSSSILFCVLTVEAFLLAAVVSFKYNSVKVFNKKIRTEIISNNFWIFYFLLVGTRSMAEVLRLGLSNTLTQYTYYKYFDWIVLAFYGIGALALSLALNYQRKYRSSASEQQKPKEKKGMERDGSVININANANGVPNGMNGHATGGGPGMNRPTSPTGARPGTPLLPPQPNQPDLEMSMTDSQEAPWDHRDLILHAFCRICCNVSAHTSIL